MGRTARRSAKRRKIAGISAVSVGSIALIVAMTQLLGGDPGAQQATAAPPTNRPTVSGPNGDDAAATPTPTPTAATNLSAGLQAQIPKGSGIARIHTVTVAVQTSTPIRWAYAWRDKYGPGELVTQTNDSATRTYRSILPASVVALQLSGLGGTASCTITVDGVMFTKEVATGPYQMAVCFG